MQLHNLQPKTKKKPAKRIGRGGKRGTYSGRGMKGQKSRAGTHKQQPVIRELIKRYHKARGYRKNWKGQRFFVVSLGQLDKSFKPGEKVEPKILLQKGLIVKIKNKLPAVKILANGELKKKLIVERCSVSKQAKEKLEKAGGTVEEF